MGQLDPLRQQQAIASAFRTRAEAEMAVTVLAAYGLTGAVSVGHVDVAFPSLSFVQGFRVVVDEAHVEAARRILGPPPDDDPTTEPG